MIVKVLPPKYIDWVSLSISYCLFTSSAGVSPLSVPHSQSHKKFKQIKLAPRNMELLVCLGLGLISSIHRPIDFCLNGSPNISPPSGWHPPTAMHRITCQIHNFQIESDHSYNMNIFAQGLNSLHQIHPDTPNPLEQPWYFCNLLSWTIHHLQKSPYGQKSVFF